MDLTDEIESRSDWLSFLPFRLLLLFLTLITAPLVLVVLIGECQKGGPIAGISLLYALFIVWQFRFLGTLIIQLFICIGLKWGGGK